MPTHTARLGRIRLVNPLDTDADMRRLISVFERGCLSRPVGDLLTLQHRVSALEAERNAARATIRWQFTSHQARVTLADLYPITKNKAD